MGGGVHRGIRKFFMSKFECLFTQYSRILKLKEIGYSHNEIALLLSKELNIEINEQTIKDLFRFIKNNTLNKKYDSVILFDVSLASKSNIDINITCVYMNELLISNPIILKYFDLNHYVLTAKNFTNLITTAEGLLYAKRLLKQYHLADEDLLNDFYLKNPLSKKVNYDEIISNIHNNLANDVAENLKELKTVLTYFIGR